MKIILGAGSNKYDGWISTDKDELNLLSIKNWLERDRKSVV